VAAGVDVADIILDRFEEARVIEEAPEFFNQISDDSSVL
jgi:hypothetical protein